MKALPEGAETLTFQMTNDELSKIGFPSRQLLPGECGEFLEVLRVHELRKRHIERGDSIVSVVSSHRGSIRGLRRAARRASFFPWLRRHRCSMDVMLSGAGFRTASGTSARCTLGAAFSRVLARECPACRAS